MPRLPFRGTRYQVANVNEVHVADMDAEENTVEQETEEVQPEQALRCTTCIDLGENAEET